MRTLSATLEAAQQAPHRLPYVEAKVYDYRAGIKRLTWTRVYEGTEPDNHHGIAIDGQGSIHRIRVEGTNLYRQKQVTPFSTSFPYTFPMDLAEPPDFSSWTLVSSDCAGPCAIAAYGSKVYIFYRQNSVNQLRKCYSHDYGDNWTDAILDTYQDVISMAADWWSTGSNVLLVTLRTNEIAHWVLDTDTQTIVKHRTVTFTAPHTHIITDTFGVGVTYSSRWGQAQVVFAGLQSDTPYDHYNIFRCTISAGFYYFSSLESFIMAPDGEDITYEYPDCHFPPDGQGYEETTITLVDKYTGTTAYTRPLTCHPARGTAFSDTAFTEPRPFLNISPAYGLRIFASSGHWWIEKPNGVWRAPRPAASPLVLTSDSPSGRIVALNLNQSPSYLQSPLTITLDNSKGDYSPLNLLNKLNKRYELVLKLGYKTTAGDETSEAGTYWVDGWQYSTNLNESLLSLYCLDGWGLMQRWTARHHMRWNKNAVNPRSVWQILYQLLARVGIKLTNTPTKPQSSAINNFYPDFAVNPGTAGDTAIKRLLSFVPDGLVFRGQEAFTKNPLATESSCYSYDVIASGAWQSHPILTGEYREALHASRSRALGRDSSDNRILEEAQDWDLLQLAIDILEQDYDPNLQTATRAQERADAILRQMSLRAERGNLVVPTNVGQELLDVVEVTDARCGISQENYRVQTIRTDYDRRKRQYDQRLTLGSP